MIIDRTFERWRDAARMLLAQGVPPTEVIWTDDEQLALDLPLPVFRGRVREGAIGDGQRLSTFAPTLPSPGVPGEGNKDAASPLCVPAKLVSLFRLTACHRDADRWEVMYRVLWRITHGEPCLLDIAVDDDMHRLLAMEKAVRRDRHKMHAFVRFRKIDAADGERYIAWHRPDHFILRLATPHFVDRFAAMHWTILTPDESAEWDGQSLSFGPGVPRREAPSGDEWEELWKSYYASIFNPNRLKVKAMTAELPTRHWRTLPEAELIPDLIRSARQRAARMEADAEALPEASAARFVPASRSLPQLREAARTCRGCELHCNATQTVFGEGPANAKLMFVGEQPGDQEDLVGRPFVGPAGQLLDEALQAVGIRREDAYFTNTVKHFKWQARGKRRIHRTPSARDVSACRPWLEAEIQAIRPAALVCLGGTAAKALLGRGFQVTRERGVPRETPWAQWTIATFHPSALLRIPDPAAREQASRLFAADLALAAERLHVVG